MNKILGLILIASVVTAGAYKYNGSTVSAVVLSGGIIKAQHTDIEKKYKRKDCPICKGKGFYISGDGIKKVDCGYCEPEKTQPVLKPSIESPKVTIHPPMIIKQNCPNGDCPAPSNKIKGNQ